MLECDASCSRLEYERHQLRSREGEAVEIKIQPELAERLYEQQE